MPPRGPRAAKRALPDLAALPPWRPAPAPACALVTRSEPFFASGWLYELKYDGFRALLARTGDSCSLTYRSGRDASALFPEILNASAPLASDGAVLDGELVVPGTDGRPDFETMRARGLASRYRPGAPAATFCAFDLLALRGRDVRQLPLVHRKRLLRALLRHPHPRLLYVDHVDDAHGARLLSGARALRMEGIVAKPALSPYRAGTAPGWLKFKLEDTSDFVILAVCDPSPATFEQPGALLGCVTSRGLRPVGRVALPPRARSVLEDLLPALRVASPPFRTGPGVRAWLRPALVCEVRHLPRDSGGLRHPVFVRLRPDKPWHECLEQ